MFFCHIDFWRYFQNDTEHKQMTFLWGDLLEQRRVKFLTLKWDPSHTMKVASLHKNKPSVYTETLVKRVKQVEPLPGCSVLHEG